MVRLGSRNVRKASEGKVTLAGEKQVFRRMADGRFVEDIIGLPDDTPEGASPLLLPVMEKGRSVGPRPTLKEIRKRFAENFSQLDERYKQLVDAERYPVALSERLMELQRRC